MNNALPIKPSQNAIFHEIPLNFHFVSAQLFQSQDCQEPVLCIHQSWPVQNLNLRPADLVLCLLSKYQTMSARASNSNSKIVNPKILNIIVQKYLFLDACHVNILKNRIVIHIICSKLDHKI